MSRSRIYIPAEDKAIEGLTRGAAILEGRRGLEFVNPENRYQSYADMLRLIEQGRGRSLDIDYTLLTVIGMWDAYSGEVRLSPGGGRLLAGWLGRQIHRGELEAKDSLHNSRQSARMKARRFDMQGRPDLAARERGKFNIRHW